MICANTPGSVVERRCTPQGEVALIRRGGDYEVVFNGVFIMSSRNGASEGLLARAALERAAVSAGRLRGEGLRVLVGGLGIGYTLRAALDFDGVGRVDVAEIEPVILEWCERYFSVLNGDALSDPRCSAATADVLDVARGAGGGATPYHAVLLDTDNGPDWLVLDRNRRLYEPESLRVFRSALTPGGVLGIWSAGTSDRLEAAMREVFGNVERLEVRPAPPAGDSAGESGSRTPPDFIYLSRRRLRRRQPASH